MVTSEHIDVDRTGKMMNCSPTSYKIPNVRSIPRNFNVTLLKNHDFLKTVYSAKVSFKHMVNRGSYKSGCFM